MRVLIACESSGRIRDAFRARGHDAWSCDLLSCESEYWRDFHIQADHDLHIFDIIDDGNWDLLIAHPPCTHLASSGAKYFAEKKADGRQEQAKIFFMAFTKTKVLRYCIENPVGIMSSEFREPNQIIQPYQFGHPESKATCLWLKNLEPLKPTNVVEPEYYMVDGKVYRDKKGKRYSKTHYFSGRMQARWRNQTKSGQNKLPPSADRATIRSRTYIGIAQAMAEQWGNPEILPLFNRKAVALRID